MCLLLTNYLFLCFADRELRLRLFIIKELHNDNEAHYPELRSPRLPVLYLCPKCLKYKGGILAVLAIRVGIELCCGILAVLAIRVGIEL
jgi:hypothetical protein